MCEINAAAYECMYCRKNVPYSHSVCEDCSKDELIVNTVKVRQIEHAVDEIGHRLDQIESICRSFPRK